MNKTKTPEELAHQFIELQQPVDPICTAEDRHALEMKMFLAGYYSAKYQNQQNNSNQFLPQEMSDTSDQALHLYAMYMTQLAHEKTAKMRQEIATFTDANIEWIDGKGWVRKV
jgi:hypothetical protein